MDTWEVMLKISSERVTGGQERMLNTNGCTLFPANVGPITVTD